MYGGHEMARVDGNNVSHHRECSFNRVQYRFHAGVYLSEGTEPQAIAWRCQQFALLRKSASLNIWRESRSRNAYRSLTT